RGNQRSSESINAIHSCVLARRPWLRAAPGPRCSALINLVGICAYFASISRTISALSSVEPSSTTIISDGGNVCWHTDSSVELIHAAELKLGQTTENILCAHALSD